MAAAMEARSLKQALIESLSAILSSDQQARQMAEEHLKLLEVTEGNKCFDYRSWQNLVEEGVVALRLSVLRFWLFVRSLFFRTVAPKD